MKDTLLIYRAECLSCSHLCPLLTTAYDCAGEARCPAQFVKIVLGTDHVAAARALLAAERSQDHAKLSRLHTRLALLDEDVQGLVTAELQRLREL